MVDRYTKHRAIITGGADFMCEDKSGQWVLYQDHEREVDRLKAEVERLRGLLAGLTDDGHNEKRQYPDER